MEIAFKVCNQNISRIDTNEVVGGSRNYLKARFQFETDEWQGIKTAIFKHKGKPYNKILDENDMCDVPWEVIDSPCFTVSVFCGDLVTTDAVMVLVQESGYAEGDESQEPTPDVYTQILAKLDALTTGGGNSAELTETVEDIRADVDKINYTLGYSNKNLVRIPNTINDLVKNGITSVINANRSVTFNGTANYPDYEYFADSAGIDLKAGVTYVMTGSPRGYSGCRQILFVRSAVSTDGSLYARVIDTGEGATYTPSEDENGLVTMRIAHGTTVTNVTFYPMLREAGTSDTYEPHTDDVLDRVGDLEKAVTKLTNMIATLGVTE